MTRKKLNARGEVNRTPTDSENSPEIKDKRATSFSAGLRRQGGAPVIINFSSEEFAAEAATFFKSQPKAVGEFAEKFPPIPLLLFFAPYAESYMWYPLAPQEDIGRVIEYAMEKRRFVPIGACLLAFARRGERIHLSESLPYFVDPNFDAEEVLNGTLPFFMKEKFNYDLKSFRISDLTKN